MSSPAESAVNTLRVLIVDDHPLVRDGLTLAIEAKQTMLVVGETDNGRSALELVAQLRPHLVLMDLMLPCLGGIAATEQIKTVFPDVKVLVLTASEDPESVERALTAGASGVVFKRSLAGELMRAIDCIVNGGLYLDVDVSARAEAAQGPAQPALSEREREVLQLLAAGHTARDGAIRLRIGVRTLETYRARAMQKLALKNRADIVRYAAAQGWLRGD